MTTPAQPAQPDQRSSNGEGPCCGGRGLANRGDWVPKEGERQVTGCMFCAQSGRHWRHQEA